jgi:hypothetical protein
MTTRARKYQNFWEGVGKGFPDLGGAASTRYYAQNEERLLTEHFPALEGLTILKTDLWDEAKNTRTLVGRPAGCARLRHRHLRTHRPAGTRRLRGPA